MLRGGLRNNMAKEKTFAEVRAEEKDKKCLECGGELVFEKGELVCKKCGLVLD